MPVEKGDFVLVDYVARIVDDNKVFDTTIAEEAKKAGIYSEDARYEPLLVVVGQGVLLKAVEEALVGMNEGEEKVIEVPPEKAFGKRDPKKIRVIPAVELSKRGIIPRVNMQVEIDGRVAIIRSVGSGRVQLDFNHPLAGKTLEYKVKVVKILKTPDEKVKALIKKWLPHVADKAEVQVEDGSLRVKLPLESLGYERLNILLRGLIGDIARLLKEFKEVSFTISAKLKEEEEEKKESKEEAKEEAEKKEESKEAKKEAEAEQA